LGELHVPHVPPQPSGPHFLPTQLGTHWQMFTALQIEPGLQVPHVPPHPSEPQFL
jgi:hypothetical protein